MAPKKRWIVPVDDDETIELSIDEDFEIVMRRNEKETLSILSPLAACQVGQALQDASREAGQAKARAEERAAARAEKERSD